ncbi:MAG: acyl carrier protein [Candidatus Krumholzibacteriia bacterium]|nr:acyl carrier protein [bacterium]MCB9514407.1 acyl carrier protein [Candidatus Latescibacterota bacterium]MCB9516656.1 acyl carrier protein [Candidatus Latescibacterota bacterium]
MENTIRQFIVDNFLAGKDDPSFKNHDSFMETRVIDSTGIMELLEFVEDEWGISVNDSELTPENFDSVSKVASFVQGKLG